MDKHITALANLFKALADATRLRILGLLLTGEVCVCHIHEKPEDPAAEGVAPPRRTCGAPAWSRRGATGLWVHYRLAETPDPIAATIVDAAAHALIGRRGRASRWRTAAERNLLRAGSRRESPACRAERHPRGQPEPPCKPVGAR